MLDIARVYTCDESGPRSSALAGHDAQLLQASPGQHRDLLLEELHETGHAAVYLAIDQMLARMLALEVDLRELDDDSKRNPSRERRTQALFEHEHIVRVFDVGELEDVHDFGLASTAWTCLFGGEASPEERVKFLDRARVGGRSRESAYTNYLDRRLYLRPLHEWWTRSTRPQPPFVVAAPGRCPWHASRSAPRPSASSSAAR